MESEFSAPEPVSAKAELAEQGFEEPVAEEALEEEPVVQESTTDEPAMEVSIEEQPVAEEDLPDEEDWLMDGISKYDAIAEASRAALIAGAAKETRTADLEEYASQVEGLSESIDEAGVADKLQGEELLAASAEVDEAGAQVSLLGLERRTSGLEIGRIAGELSQISHEVREEELALLSAVLGSRSERLQELAAELVASAASARELASLLDETGDDVGDLGANEVDEGVERLEVARELAAHAAEAGKAELKLDE